MKRKYTIEGDKCTTVKGFFNEVERKLTKGLNFKIGRNLNAFNDVLWGGFGEFECEEKIILSWKDIETSKKLLKKDFFDAVLETIQEHENVTFITPK